MNHVTLCGKLCTIPVSKYLPIEEKRNLFMCKFVIGTIDGMDEEGKEILNFFECVAFEDAARQICDRFINGTGTKVIVEGSVKNHLFQDGNDTHHFTQIIMVEKIEVGDNIYPQSVKVQDEKEMESPIIADNQYMEKMFGEVCAAGFLCVDEDDYFSLATSNMAYLKKSCLNSYET